MKACWRRRERKQMRHAMKMPEGQSISSPIFLADLIIVIRLFVINPFIAGRIVFASSMC
jgi:hypothetical protein